MPNPGRVSFQIQLAVFEGALVASHRLSVHYLKLLSRQQQSLADSPLRRNGDGNGKSRPVPFPCTGADLQAHYGHRHLDVDVERL